MKAVFSWDEYRKYLENSINKPFVDAYYNALFENEKWGVFVFRYKVLIMPFLKKIAPKINHEAIWEKRKDDFTKELILYCWNVSKYRTNQHELGYKDEDIKRLVYDILASENATGNKIDSTVKEEQI